MATDNLQALFGGTMLPQDMQQELINQRAQQFAQLSPSQQLGVMGYKTGAAIGGGLAQAMGVDITDPRIKRQSQLQSLAQGVENTPEGLKAFSKKLSDAGFTAEAAQAMDKAREIAATEAGTGLKTAQAKKAENYEMARTDSEKKRNLLSDVEQALASGEQVDPAKLNQARLAWAQETKPKTFQQPDGSIATVPGVDVNLFPNIGKALSSGGAGGISKAGNIETKASQAMAEKEVSAIESSITGIDDSLNAVKGIRDIRVGSISTNPFLVEQMKKYPTAAKAQDNLLKTITAGKVVETIMEMKQQSKTGATGFGALSTRELDLLESTARALDPASPTFEKDLKYIEDKLVAAKTKLQSSLAKKQPAQVPQGGGNGNWQNPQGKEGQLAILNAELATAQQQGNQANIAGLQREIARLGGQAPAAKGKMTDEQKIMTTLSDPRNKGRSRADIEAALRKAGQIQ